jgi:cytidylate kinase
MVITIDGPAGTGKSTVARRVAAELGFAFLDTGAMYRAVAHEALRRGTELTDGRELAFVARHCRIDFDYAETPPGVLLNGERVSHLLRSGEVTRAASFIAVVPAIRELMVERQRVIGRERGRLVTEGRDQGTVVFPDAGLKIFLTASADERARRRARELRDRGEVVDLAEIRQQIEDRDHRDSTRAVAPLAAAPGAVRLDTTVMSVDDVVGRIVTLARATLAGPGKAVAAG